MTYMERLEAMRKRIGSAMNPDIGTATVRPVTMDASNVSQMPEDQRLALADKVAKLKIVAPPSASGMGEFRGFVPAIQGAGESVARTYDYLTTGSVPPQASPQGPVSATVDEVIAQQGARQPQSRGTGIFLDGGQREWERPGQQEGLQPIGTQGLRPGEVRIGDFQGTVQDYEARRDAMAPDPARFERNRESFRNALVGTGVGQSGENLTATQIGDKRELDKRKALIETMAEGPDKQDALARLQDEEAAKREAGVKDSDRYTGSIGSTDWKERQGRMEAYKQKLTELSNNRLMTKQQAGAAMAQARKIEKEQFEFDQKILTAEQKQEDRDTEAELMQRGLTEKKSIAAANSGFRSMATFNGKIGGKGPRINGAQVTDMFMQMDPVMRMDVMEEAARNVEHYEMDPRAAFMAAFTPFMKMRQRQTS